MNIWKVILATLVIFVAGVVTGGLLVSFTDRVALRVHRKSALEPVRSGANPVNPRNLPGVQALPNRLSRGVNLEFLQKLDAEIQLTAEQREHIEKIIAKGQNRNKEIWERVAPEIRHVNVETQKQIREVLRPKQREHFEELMKQRLQRRSDESGAPGSRPREPRRQPPPFESDASSNPAAAFPEKP